MKNGCGGSGRASLMGDLQLVTAGRLPIGHSDLSNHSYFLIINMKKMDLVEFIDYHFSCRKIAVLQNRIQQGVTNYETRHPDPCSFRRRSRRRCCHALVLDDSRHREPAVSHCKTADSNVCARNTGLPRRHFCTLGKSDNTKVSQH